MLFQDLSVQSLSNVESHILPDYTKREFLAEPRQNCTHRYHEHDEAPLVCISPQLIQICHFHQDEEHLSHDGTDKRHEGALHDGHEDSEDNIDLGLVVPHQLHEGGLLGLPFDYGINFGVSLVFQLLDLKHHLVLDLYYLGILSFGAEHRGFQELALNLRKFLFDFVIIVQLDSTLIVSVDLILAWCLIA